MHSSKAVSQGWRLVIVGLRCRNRADRSHSTSWRCWGQSTRLSMGFTT